MVLRVEREQVPVGQGCFSIGTIKLAAQDANPDRALRYIYDCGARNHAILRDAIEYQKAHLTKINALFISHFDNDHVAGLDLLLAGVSVDTVYIPYIDNVAPILEVIEAMEDGISASFLHMCLEPESWFGQRGVRRVVRVHGGGELPHDGPDLVLRPDTENPTTPDPQQLDFKESRPAKRARHRGSLGKSCLLEQVEQGTSVLIASRGHTLGWALIPYVHPAPRERSAAFMRRLRVALGLTRGDVLNAERLAAALRSPTDRDKVRACYDEVISRGATRRHNRLSMSLYSGPVGHRECARDRRCMYQTAPVLPLRDAGAGGWLGTGDADLKSVAVRKEWRAFYKSVGANVASLLLPHHGSHRNFDPEILDFPNLDLCIAVADEPQRGYKHPSDTVVLAVARKRKWLWHVSKEPRSGLVGTIICGSSAEVVGVP